MDTSFLDVMQFAYIVGKDPINTTGSPRETISFQYATTAAPVDLPSGRVYTGWTALTAAEKTAFESQLDHIETFLNVEFVETTGSDDPDMNVGKVTIAGATTGYGGNTISFSGTRIASLDSFAVFDNTVDISEDAQINLILHELGHALGLQHPFDATGALPAGTENNKYTVMSYTDNPDNGEPSDAMMLYDVFSLQDVWGSAAYNTGKTTYTGPRTDTVDTIWDTGGTDTLDASARTGAVTLDLREGKFSTFGTYEDVAIAYGVKIENAKGGAGNDTITGNKLNNVIKAGGGDDSVTGGGGKDRINGGGGNDGLAGNGGRDKLSGQGGDDTLTGGGGNDTMHGGNGSDKMTGGGGSDKFVYKKNGDADTVRDFADDIDTLVIRKLGSLSEVLARASNVGGDVVFDFGGGDMLTVRDTTKGQISDDIIV